MKVFKHMTALVLALVMAAALAVTAYAATVTVKYREFVYSGQITFRQYDYSQSTSPTVINMTISATSSLGSGSALYHVKYANGTVAYCIQPGVHSDDSGSYVQGSSGCWYNLPASVERHRAGAGLRLSQRRLRYGLRRPQQQCHRQRREMGGNTGHHLGAYLRIPQRLYLR